MADQQNRGGQKQGNLDPLDVARYRSGWNDVGGAFAYCSSGTSR